MKKIYTIIILIFLISGIPTEAQNGNGVSVIQELSNTTFKQKVWNYEKNSTFKRIGNIPVILDFYATWCRPCKMLAPNLQEIQKKYKGKLLIYEIDVDKEPELAGKFKIEAMPTLIFINSPTNYTTEVGYLSLIELEKIIKQKFSF